MNDLIAALQILAKYSNEHAPTHCEHDVLYVPTVDYDAVSADDKKALKRLGFSKNTDGGEGFMSYRFGSC